MAISVNWNTNVIFVPQADLTSLGGGVYELDLDVFRLSLKAIEAGEGITFTDLHKHTTEATLSGTTFARVVEILSPYTVEFEDLQYAVNLVGANSNIPDKAVVNQVSIRSFNTGGLVVDSTMPTQIATEVWNTTVSGPAGSMGSAIQKLIAHAGENKVVKVLTKDTNGNPLTQLVRLYDTAANATTDDGVTGLLAALTVSANFTAKSMDDFKSTA